MPSSVARTRAEAHNATTHQLDPSLGADHRLPAAAIVMPAIATACYGIRLLGDFEETVHRSERAREKLIKLKNFIETEAPSLAELRTRARQASATMLQDLESWRVGVESRNLSV